MQVEKSAECAYKLCGPYTNRSSTNNQEFAQKNFGISFATLRRSPEAPDGIGRTGGRYSRHANVLLCPKSFPRLEKC